MLSAQTGLLVQSTAATQQGAVMSSLATSFASGQLTSSALRAPPTATNAGRHGASVHPDGSAIMEAAAAVIPVAQTPDEGNGRVTELIGYASLSSSGFGRVNGFEFVFSNGARCGAL